VQLPAYEDGTACSETSAYKIQTPGNYPKESIQLWTLLVTFCIVIIWCTETFWSPCINVCTRTASHCNHCVHGPATGLITSLGIARSDYQRWDTFIKCRMGLWPSQLS